MGIDCSGNGYEHGLCNDVLLTCSQTGLIIVIHFFIFKGRGFPHARVEVEGSIKSRAPTQAYSYTPTHQHNRKLTPSTMKLSLR